mmetsp:Transcript_33272/g.98972  ORF Transcript_33272/g.98972 Transcript_33272/m.98972 type:complete len:216 (-) Transcript_33272:303-950(-)
MTTSRRRGGGRRRRRCRRGPPPPRATWSVNHPSDASCVPRGVSSLESSTLRSFPPPAVCDREGYYLLPIRPERRRSSRSAVVFCDLRRRWHRGRRRGPLASSLPSDLRLAGRSTSSWFPDRSCSADNFASRDDEDRPRRPTNLRGTAPPTAHRYNHRRRRRRRLHPLGVYFEHSPHIVPFLSCRMPPRDFPFQSRSRPRRRTKTKTTASNPSRAS